MATTSHYVVLCLPSWGHCRPELTFALRLVRLHPHLYITIFLPSFISQSTDAVISAAQLSNTELSRMAVIKYSMAGSVPEPNQANADDLLWKKFADSCADELIPTYQDFIKSEHVKTRPVDVILGDGLLYWGFRQHLETMCKELGTKIPEVYFVAPVSAAYTIR